MDKQPVHHVFSDRNRAVCFKILAEDQHICDAMESSEIGIHNHIQWVKSKGGVVSQGHTNKTKYNI